MLNIDIFIPIRLNSTRLPKKHLQKINEKPVIEYLFERLEKCHEVRHVIVCTTNQPTDNELITLLEQKNIKYFRGNEKDILKRFLDAANHFETDIIVDVEGDKVFTLPFYVDKIANHLKNNDSDFVIGNDSITKFNPSNHFIHGISPSGFKKKALEKICQSKHTDNTDTGYHNFFLNSESIKSTLIPIKTDEFLDKIRLTLDYPEDLKFAETVFNQLKNNFSEEELITFFRKNPLLCLITKDLDKKWKLNYNKLKSC